MKRGAFLLSAYLEMMPQRKRGGGRGVQTRFAICIQFANCSVLCWRRGGESGQDESKHRTETLAGKKDGKRRKVYWEKEEK